MTDSIFKQYYNDSPFLDRFLISPVQSVTVIIPIVHTNELWEENLKSIYREIPTAQLLIGDGGCIDDSVRIAELFPRVTVYDHRAFKSLGFSIRKLIESVQTEWFVYLHSDVYLPPGWFDSMMGHSGKYDWFGCRMRQTVLIEYDNDYGERPYAGAQIGRTAIFAKEIHAVDDDYVYRQEDFVFSDIALKGGGLEGKIDTVFHYHQSIKKTSNVWNPQNVKVAISQTLAREEEIRVWETQVKGIVKYLSPSTPWLISEAVYGTHRLAELGHLSLDEMYLWIKKTNPNWLPIIKRGVLILQVKEIIKRVKRLLKLLLKYK
jgi:hypothetical protein